MTQDQRKHLTGMIGCAALFVCMIALMVGSGHGWLAVSFALAACWYAWHFEKHRTAFIGSDC